MSARLVHAGLAAALALSPAAAASHVPALTRYPPDQLGGVTTILRYEVARPDRAETRLLFLTSGLVSAAPPQEVQVIGPDGAEAHLADQEGADCTLAHVEIVPGPRPMVLSATRVFSPDLRRNDQSRPAAMAVEAYRPERGQDAGDSRVVLRAAGPPRRTPPVCTAAEVKAAMMRVANVAAAR